VQVSMLACCADMLVNVGCHQAGLDPTHQVVKLAREAGFDNVHDYLVHLVTGEAIRLLLCSGRQAG